MMKTDPAKFAALVVAVEAIAATEGGPLFMDQWPDRWYEDGPRWRCENEHVSSRYLKSEEDGCLCLVCFAPLVLTFPEDVDGPLVAPA